MPCSSSWPIHKLQMEELSKHNRLLELQQALDRKAMETSRLYLDPVADRACLDRRSGWCEPSARRCDSRSWRAATASPAFSTTSILSARPRASCAMRKNPRAASVWCWSTWTTSSGSTTPTATRRAMPCWSRQRHLCQTHLRNVDVFGRLGGEEFGLALPDCSLDQGVEVVERIRLAIAATPVEVNIPGDVLSASFGLASTATAATTLAVLMANADAAFYRAKSWPQSGRDACRARRDLRLTRCCRALYLTGRVGSAIRVRRCAKLRHLPVECVPCAECFVC